MTCLKTYDNAEEVIALAERHGFETKGVSMKNTHHAEMNELLIGRNLGWANEGGVFREDSVPYKTVVPAKAPKAIRHRTHRRHRNGG